MLSLLLRHQCLRLIAHFIPLRGKREREGARERERDRKIKRKRKRKRKRERGNKMRRGKSKASAVDGPTKCTVDYTKNTKNTLSIY